MAYTKSPETQTYAPARFRAAHDIDLRMGTTPGNASTRIDAGMVNLLSRRIKTPGAEGNTSKQDEIQAESRPPICAAQVAATSNPVRGMYVWEKTAGTVYYFVVVSTSVYTSTTGLAGSWTAVTTLATAADTPVGFVEFINATNNKSLVLVDGVEGFVFTSNAAGTKIADADFPTPHIPMPVYLDGYLFLVKKDTGDIYNSKLDDPANWITGEFISSELYPDDIVGLVKINNYLLAIGRYGSEYFYDAANASGSPLARYDGGVLPFGCNFPYTICSTKNSVMFLANNNDGEAVLKVVEDFKAKEVDAPWLTSYIASALTAGASYVNLRSYLMREGSDLMYVIRVPGTTTTDDAGNGVFAFSMDTQMWTELALGTDKMFNVYATCFSTSGNAVTFVAGTYHTGGFAFFGTLGPSTLSSSYFTTYGVDYLNGSTTTLPLTTVIRTTAQDFGTLNLKFMNRFGVVMTTNTQSTTPSLTLAWSDTDYNFTNSATFTADYNYPFVTQLGAFRRRAFKITGSGAVSYRFQLFEVEINKGQQ